MHLFQHLRVFTMIAGLVLGTYLAHGQQYIMTNGQTITTCGGVLFDPGGSTADYGNNLNVVETFCSSEPGKCIWINFTIFNTEAGGLFSAGDVLTVYNGSNTSAPVLYTLSGNDGNFDTPISGSNGCITLRFRTDNNGTRAGFRGEISCIPCPIPQNVSQQDCSGAIPVCQGQYFQPNSYLGQGANPNEIANTCLGTNEKNDVWYVFTVQQGGDLKFIITPVDPDDDYDWAVYDITGSTCADIPNLTPRRCNYSADVTDDGRTGVNSDAPFNGTLNNQPATGSPYCSTMAVTAGKAYLLNVSNFEDTGQNGYFLDFSYSTAVLFDNVQPELVSIDQPIPCGSNQITATFSEPVVCTSVTAADFQLTGPGGPYTITNITGNGCNGAGTFASEFTVTVSPPLVNSGTFQFSIINTVVDNCGNETPSNTFTFNIQNITSNAGADRTFCAGTTQNITLGGNPTTTSVGATIAWAAIPPSASTYLSSTSGANPTLVNSAQIPVGSYQYVVTVSNGNCIGRDTVRIIVQDCCNTTLTTALTNETCNLDNGAINLTVSNGTAPYTYLWSTNATTQDISQLSAACYTVTVTDQTGCVKTAQACVTNSSSLAVTETHQNTTCGLRFGSIDITASGGVSPYTYAWSNSATTEDLANLSPATYCVTVTDASSCVTTLCTTIEDSEGITLDGNTTPSACGNANGAIDLLITTGNPPYTYVWDNGASTQDLSGLAQGSYCVTVSDNDGCTANLCFNILSSANPTATEVHNNTICGQNNGNIDVSVANGTSPYSYSWSDGATTEDRTMLAAGNYGLTITDAQGCNTTLQVTISSSQGLQIQNIQKVCSVDGSTYTVTFEITGGDSGNYSVAGGTLTGNVFVSNPVPSGSSNTFTVEDGFCTPVTISVDQTCVQPTSCSGASGCFGNNLVIDGDFENYNPNNPFATFTSQYQPNNGTGTCTANQNCDGPYLCQNGFAVVDNLLPCNPTWSPNIDDHTSGSGNFMAIDYPTGSTNNIWCQSFTLNANTEYCFGGYFINILPVGANIPPPSFVFTLNGVSISTSPSVAEENEQWEFKGVSFNSGAGGLVTLCIRNEVATNYVGYDLGMDDISLREISTGITPTAFNDTVTLCPGSSGIIPVLSNDSGTNTSSVLTITTTPPFNDGDASVNADGTITFTPAIGFSGSTSFAYQVCNGGCCDNAVVVINAADSPSVTITGDNTLCTETTLVAQSSEPVTYSWSTGATTQQITVNQAGTYTVTVTNQNSCTATSSFTVILDPINLLQSHVNTTCGLADGSINLSVSGGGSSTYTYAWNNGVTTQDQTGLSAGNYVVTVTNSEACTSTLAITVAPSTPISITETHTNTSCGLNNGAIDLTVSGGGTSYTYSWSNGATTQDISALAAASYNVTVTSNTGCTSTLAITITPSTPISITETHTNTSCGLNNGAIDLTVSGGGTSYTYSWSNGATTQDISALAAGSYNITVTSNNSCSQTQTITITNSIAPSVTIAGDTSLCVSVTLDAGIGYVSYNWSNGTTTQTTQITEAGTYSVTVTDTNGCTATDNFTVIDAPQILLTGINLQNPTCNQSNGSITIVGVTGGVTPYTYDFGNGASSANTINGLSAGQYNFTVTDAKGCTVLSSAQLDNTGAPQPSFIVTDVTCNSGGSPCQYEGKFVVINELSILPGQAADSLNADVHSLYNPNKTGQEWIELYNPNPCQAINLSCYRLASYNAPDNNFSFIFPNTIVILPLQHLTIGANANAHINLNDLSPGLLTGTPRAHLPNQKGWIALYDPQGLPVDAFYWGDTLDVFNATIFDSEPPVIQGNCDTAPALLSAYEMAQNQNIQWMGATQPFVWGSTLGRTTDGTNSTNVLAIPTPNTCNNGNCAEPFDGGGCDGAVSLSISGGTAPYTWVWSTGDINTPAIGELCAGVYYIQITDASGCSTIDSVFVNMQPSPSITATTTPVTCNGSTNGSIDVSVTDGTSPYTYNWSNGATTPDLTNLSAGSYALTVTDANGCDSEFITQVSEPAALVLTPTNGSVACNASDGTANITSQGGTQPYSYLWSTGATTASINNLSQGTYTVTVTDANGCTQTAAANITEGNAHSVVLTPTSPQCYNGNNGGITTQIAGGTAPYTFAWDNNLPAQQNQTGLSAGTYAVTVTDANGCVTTANTTITNPNPLVPDLGTDITIEYGQSATLTVDPANDNATYTWTAEGGFSQTGSSITVSPTNTTTYTVTATFAGCSETDNITVVVTENGSFGIPNAFTPNGDQKNDLFEVLTDGGIAITQCRIFDRWGQLVYDNPLAQWDGTFEGKPLPMDVYVYQIVFTRINGVQETHTGDVTLLR